MAAPSLFPDDFQRLERIGRGSFGNVYRGTHVRTGVSVALKVVDLEAGDDDVDVIQREVAMLSQCRSRFVTEYIGCFLLPEHSELWIVMEYMAASVKDVLERGPLSEASAGAVLRGALNALSYLHSQKKIHRDMKAANLLISSTGVVKLADFGVSGNLSMTLGSKRASFVGTPFWMAPEVIQQGGAAPTSGGVDGYDESADIWSMGITLIEMLKGEPPWADIHPMRVLFLIPKEPAPRLDAGTFGPHACDLIVQCCSKDAKARPSARELLGHPFVTRAPEVTDELMERIRARIATTGRSESVHDDGGTGTVIGGQSWARYRRGDLSGGDGEQGSIGNDSSTTEFWDFDTVAGKKSSDNESPPGRAETPSKLRAADDKGLGESRSRHLSSDIHGRTNGDGQQLAAVLKALRASTRSTADEHVIHAAVLALEGLEDASPGFSGRFLSCVGSQRSPSSASSVGTVVGNGAVKVDDVSRGDAGNEEENDADGYTLRKFLRERWKHMNTQHPSVLGLSRAAKEWATHDSHKS